MALQLHVTYEGGTKILLGWRGANVRLANVRLEGNKYTIYDKINSNTENFRGGKITGKGVFAPITPLSFEPVYQN